MTKITSPPFVNHVAPEDLRTFLRNNKSGRFGSEEGGFTKLKQRYMNTRIWIYSLTAVIIMASCGDGPEPNTTTAQTEQETFQSKQVQGHWTTDKNTAMELRAMQSTIENFNLLIKKQPQNLMAYQGYAASLKNHVNRTVTFCSLDKNARSLLCKSLDKINEQLAIIEKGDIKQARDAAGNINRIFSEIDNSFNFSY